MKSDRGLKRGTIWWLIATPGARTYLIVGLAALMIHFLVMSGQGGELGAMLLIVLAVPGLIVGWVVSPALFILLSTYLFIDPNFEGLTNGYRSRYSGSLRGPNTPLFSLEDLLLASSGLGYLIAHFRLQSLAFRGMPLEPRIKRKGESEKDLVRPHELVNDAEMGVVLVLTMSAVILGQFVWWLLVMLERRFSIANVAMVQLVIGRLMLFTFVFGGATFVATFVFSYFRWIRMNRHEAELILQDEVWAETRREHERILHWRKWHLKKTPEEAQENLK